MTREATATIEALEKIHQLCPQFAAVPFHKFTQELADMMNRDTETRILVSRAIRHEYDNLHDITDPNAVFDSMMPFVKKSEVSRSADPYRGISKLFHAKFVKTGVQQFPFPQ